MRQFKISTQRNAPLLDIGVENNGITSIPVVGELFDLFLSKEDESRSLIIANFDFLCRLEELFSVQNEYKNRIDFVHHYMRLVADNWKLRWEEF